MIHVEIGFSVDDLDLASIREILRVLSPVLSAEEGVPWHIDLRGCQYLGPTASVILASARLMATLRHQVVTVQMPTSPQRLVAFMNFSGLKHCLEHGSVRAPVQAEHPSNETVELQLFHKESRSGSSALVELVRRHFALGRDSEDILRTCYSEIAQNIQDHAQSPIGGVSCARYFASRQEIRIAIADLGLGIAETLRRSVHSRQVAHHDTDALSLVVGGGVSSKSRPNNMGQGISNLAIMAAGNEGRLILLSGRGQAHIHGQGRGIPELKDLPPPGFPGTIVLLSLRVASGGDEDDHE